MFDKCAVVETPVGPVAFRFRNGVITGVDLEPDISALDRAPLPAPIAERLAAYFRDGSVRLDLRVVLAGTPFQRRVWAVLRSIPPGRTLTYGAVAQRLATSPRAVGGACRANPCPILVPCHRVVAANGLGGFAGDTRGRRLEVKRRLLRHEGAAAY